MASPAPTRPEDPISAFPRLELQASHHTHLAFIYMDFWDPDSGPQTQQVF